VSNGRRPADTKSDRTLIICETPDDLRLGASRADRLDMDHATVCFIGESYDVVGEVQGVLPERLERLSVQQLGPTRSWGVCRDAVDDTAESFGAGVVVAPDNAVADYVGLLTNAAVHAWLPPLSASLQLIQGLLPGPVPEPAAAPVGSTTPPCSDGQMPPPWRSSSLPRPRRTCHVASPCPERLAFVGAGLARCGRCRCFGARSS
jgi:hypothetical protein